MDHLYRDGRPNRAPDQVFHSGDQLVGVDRFEQIVMFKHEEAPGLRKLTAVRKLCDGKEHRRISILCGNGGSAGNANHLANDFTFSLSRRKGSGIRVHSLSANPAVLTCLAQRLTRRLTDATSRDPLPAGRLRHQLFKLTVAEDVWPYMQLWLEIAALAARGDAFYFSVGNTIGQGFQDWIAAQLIGGSRVEALRLLTLIEGRLVLKSIGLRDVEG